jgi:histidinol-phosphatase (PHP family)
MSSGAPPWRVSLHGGHSGEYCDHATGTLREVLEAAVSAGFAAYGVSEHAPRTDDALLYDEERKRGWDVATLRDMFERYTAELDALATEFEGRLHVLRGFELEVVPGSTWLQTMRTLRQGPFDFVVGSVHHVDELLIDGPLPLFEQALEGRGGLEPLAIAYYEAVAEMVRAFRPEVVGHLDLIRKNGHRYGDCTTPAIRQAALRALDAVAEVGAILDLNVAALRKGLGTPYPEPWLVDEAKQRGVPFCFGDDSHAPDQVGLGIDEGRAYLLDCGVNTITMLERRGGAVARHIVPLD